MKSVLETFNAKHHDSKKLTSTFVPSTNFRKVAQSGHTIIIGPRGSGKTTLLRMLTTSALQNWTHSEADMYRSEIEYEGVYVPGDIVWGQMIRTLSRVGISEDCANAFAYTSFSTHVFYSLMEALQVSLNKFILISGEDNLGKLSGELTTALFSISRILKLNIERVSISKIRAELGVRLTELGEYSIDVVETRELSLQKLRVDLPYSKLDMKQCVELILSEFDHALGRPEHKWALLLDEFEIAPNYLVERVITSMRSAANKLMLKIALVPCASQANLEAEVSSYNDHQIVDLWYRKRGESKAFCEDILLSTFGISDPVAIFGKTDFMEDESEQLVDSIEADSEVKRNELKAKAFEELYSKDESFKKYIDTKKIDISNEFKKTRIDSRIRKVTPIVFFRNEFLSSSGMKKPKPSIAKFYTGWDAITRISEGNPRWLIATVSNLLSNRKNTNSKIDTDRQYLGIKASTDAFVSMIGSTAMSNNMGITSKESPFEVIKKIADYLQDQILGPDFRTDPNGTFIVDKYTPSETEKSLKIALNHGAIVSLDKSNEIWDFKTLKGKRFRISYLFSPYFKLPLRMEKEISLSTILEYEYKKKDLVNTGNLFFDFDSDSQGEIGFD